MFLIIGNAGFISSTVRHESLALTRAVGLYGLTAQCSSCRFLWGTFGFGGGSSS